MKSKLSWGYNKIGKIGVAIKKIGKIGVAINHSDLCPYALGITVELGQDWIISILVLRYRLCIYNKSNVPF